jgi:hypothetical protein
LKAGLLARSHYGYGRSCDRPTELLHTGCCSNPVSCSKCSVGNKIQPFSWSSRRINFKILSQKQPLKQKFRTLAQSFSSLPGWQFSNLLVPLLYHLRWQNFTLPQTYLFQKDERTHLMFLQNCQMSCFFRTKSISIPPPPPSAQLHFPAVLLFPLYKVCHYFIREIPLSLPPSLRCVWAFSRVDYINTTSEPTGSDSDIFRTD